MAEFLYHEPCPKCGSSDNLARYSDGSAHCFSPGCKHFEPATHGGPKVPPTAAAKNKQAQRKLIANPGLDFPVPAEFSRGITQATYRRFGTFHKVINKKDCKVYSYYNQEGQLAYQKLRFLKDKEFVVITAPEETARIKTAWLYGRHIYGDSMFRRVETSNLRNRVIIVEGEDDQHTVAQAYERDKYTAVVSPPSGADSVKAAIGANIDWLSKFDRIIFALDDDEHGRAAMEEAAPLLPEEKLYVCRWGPRKDPNAILTNDKSPGEITRRIETCSKWVRPGTLANEDFLNIPLNYEGDETEDAFEWPWPNLQARSKGAYRKGDLIVILAPSGLGKTTMLYECAAHWAKQGQRVAGLFFENAPNEIYDGFLTVGLSKPVTRNPKLLTREEKVEAMRGLGWWTNLIAEDQTRLPHSFDGVVSKIRYLAGVHDINTILIDPLSALIARLARSNNEVSDIDRMILDLADLARDLKVTIIVTHHLARPEGNLGHEEGADISLKHARGGNGIGQYVMNAIAYQAPLKKKGETACKIICKKSRWRGELKEELLTCLAFDAATGRVYEVANPKGGFIPDEMFDDIEGADSDQQF